MKIYVVARLYWDAENFNPLLFLDKAYAKVEDAEKRAKELHDLYSKPERLEALRKTLISKITMEIREIEVNQEYTPD